MSVQLLSAGAAKGLVDLLRHEIEAETGGKLEGIFSAVGEIKERFVAGPPCDVLILTAAMIDALTMDGLLVEGSAAPLGIVHTAVAVPIGQPLPVVATSADLRSSLLAATGLYVPDINRSTAGIHVLGVLRQLGIERQLSSRLRVFPNGETAMRTLATDAAEGAIGCTQITEIRYTPGLALVGKLPAPHRLATIYMAAVAAAAPAPDLARRMVAMLTGASSRPVRLSCGFEDVPKIGTDASR